jgi:PPM family protein phosphatase
VANAPTPHVADTSAAARSTRVLAAGCSDAGQVRLVNQDVFWTGPAGRHGHLVLVADGMGGHSFGEVASRAALETFVGTLMRARAPAPMALARAAQAAHLAVVELAQAHPEQQGMGTTLTTLLIDDQIGLIGHVGDSRAYRLRQGTLQQLTFDHSWVAERVRQGLLSPEEARRHRWRNVITNALGASDPFKLELHALEVRTGDRFLLCSDGLSTMVASSRIAALLGDLEPQAAADALVAEANARGSPDNVTAVVVAVEMVAGVPKGYEVPLGEGEPTALQVGASRTSLRPIEEHFPTRSLLRRYRKAPWFPYLPWFLASAGMLALIATFLLGRLTR